MVDQECRCLKIKYKRWPFTTELKDYLHKSHARFMARKHTFQKSSQYQEIVSFVHNRNIWLIIGARGGITAQNTKRSCLLLMKSSCFTASAVQYVPMGGTGINPLGTLCITAQLVIGLLTK